MLNEPGTEDKAWVEFKTPLLASQLLDFCNDIERLFRINPYLVFESWEQLGPQDYFFTATNLSQKPAFTIHTAIHVEKIDHEIRLVYENGIKSNTTISIHPIPEGSKLIIEEQYKRLPQNEVSPRLVEVDKSLTKWAEDIQSFIFQWQRWSWFSPWRFYKTKIWLPIKPSARRITFLIIAISITEIVLIALGAIIYYLEYL